MRFARSKKVSFSEMPDRPMRLRSCDCSGCEKPGEYRAPKSRDRLNDYYWFCLEHVQKYNASWDFLADHTPEEIEEEIRSSSLWDRPTWPIGEWQKRERELKEHISGFYDGGDNRDHKPDVPPPMHVGEKEALSILELAPPVDFITVKAQYRILVKQHHPDANGGSQAAEEKFKSINQAFTLLRRLYQVEETDP